MTKRIVCALLTAGLLCAAGVTGCSGGKNAGSETSQYIEPIDADEYYHKLGTVLKTTNAKKSKEVRKERDAAALIAERGFENAEITSGYSMDGSLSASDAIEADGKKKHPMYAANHITSNGELWNIVIVNDEIFACPVSYNLLEGIDRPVTLSESDHITGYDSETNQFYVTVPDEAKLRIITVEQINAEVLEKWTCEELGK